MTDTKHLHSTTSTSNELDFEAEGSENEANDVSETVDITKTDAEYEQQNVNEEQSEKMLRFPIGRIKKIMKMDPDVSLASQEAVFLISKATELLVDSLAKEAYSFTASENKKTVTRKHLESAINNIDALAFLDGALE